MSQAISTLHLLCGKVASGKSTLAAELAKRDAVVLISEDEWLSALFGDQMKSLQDYVNCALKLRPVMGRHVPSAGLAMLA
ncbi:AAA family ATPase [Ruegeria atlantica]|uniref:AAA family ATPase n=1 Tax=Ruegeria atlantica TaxID=81569 RepID=UPI0009E73588|nr:AAA family ATPase [Ruegeria atlantica]